METAETSPLWWVEEADIVCTSLCSNGWVGVCFCACERKMVEGLSSLVSDPALPSYRMHTELPQICNSRAPCPVTQDLASVWLSSAVQAIMFYSRNHFQLFLFTMSMCSYCSHVSACVRAINSHISACVQAINSVVRKGCWRRS